MTLTSNIATDLKPLVHPTEDFVYLPGNPKNGDVPKIKQSYETFGQERPIVFWTDALGELGVEPGSKVVIDGNHQLKAVRELGWRDIAASEFHGTKEQALAYAAAANRLADLGTYDNAQLVELLGEIETPELIEASGYTDADIRSMGGRTLYWCSDFR